MTKEEKLKILRTTAITPDMHPDDFSKWDEALRSAIEALSEEPCEDCIDRQALLDGIEELKKSPWATDRRGNGFEYLIKEALEVVADLCVKKAPAITPKQKMGRWEWVQYDSNPEIGNFHCSECNFIPASFNWASKHLNYCPNCGAKMQEVDE